MEYRKNEQTFEKFVESRGGSTELGTTKADNQNFSFQVNPTSLAGTLKRRFFSRWMKYFFQSYFHYFIIFFSSCLFKFAQFFLRPLNFTSCSEGVLEHAVEYVDSDFQEYSKTDTCRIEQIGKLISKTNHPYSHLFHGRSEVHIKFGFWNLIYNPFWHNICTISKMGSLVCLAKSVLPWEMSDICAPLLSHTAALCKHWTLKDISSVSQFLRDNTETWTLSDNLEEWCT